MKLTTLPVATHPEAVARPFWQGPGGVEDFQIRKLMASLLEDVARHPENLYRATCSMRAIPAGSGKLREKHHSVNVTSGLARRHTRWQRVARPGIILQQFSMSRRWCTAIVARSVFIVGLVRCRFFKALVTPIQLPRPR